MLGGIISSVILYPIDTVKRHMQLLSKLYHPKIINSINDIIKNNGVKGFYKGCFISIIKASLSSGLSFAFYSYFLNMLI